VLQPESAPKFLGQPQSVRVTATDGGATVVDMTVVVRPKEVTLTGPCPFTEWTSKVALTPQGTLWVA
jgi:hypothetical protein